MHLYHDFSWKLASRFLLNHNNESACISPVSALLPLSPVANASSGITRNEFAQLFDCRGEGLSSLLQDSRQICEALNGCPEIHELTNRLDGSTQNPFREEFLTLMRQTFGEQLQVKDHDGDPINPVQQNPF